MLRIKTMFTQKKAPNKEKLGPKYGKVPVYSLTIIRDVEKNGMVQVMV